MMFNATAPTRVVRCDYTRPGVEPYWETARECDAEFGHPHEHDDNDCDWLIVNMSPEPWNPAYDYPQYDPQADHFERFGRPMFPNEY